MSQGIQIRVKNTTNATIARAKVVYITGFDLISFVPTIALASFSNQESIPAVGLTVENINPNAIGSVKISGIVYGMDTSQVLPKTNVYVGENGNVTFSDPLEPGNSGVRSQQLGVVLTSADVGQIFIFPMQLSTSLAHQDLEDILPDDHHDQDHANRHAATGEDPLNHGTLDGLSLDHHKNYIPVDASRGFSAAFTAGQDVTVEKLTANTSIEFTDNSTQVTAANNLYISSNPNHSQSNGTTRYYPPSGSLTDGTASSTEASNQIKMSGAGTISNLRCFVHSNSINGSTVLTLRKNGAGTSLTTTVTASTTGEFEDTANSISYTDGDLLTIEVAAGGTSGTISISLIEINNQIS